MANANSNKTLQVRLQEKIDLSTNWAAKEATFVPLKGEKIVYQVDTGVSKVDKNGSTTKVYETISKTGDGVHYLKDLPYDEALAADVADWAKPLTKDGEVNASYVNVPDELAGIKANNKNLIIKDGSTTVVSYNPSAERTITLTDGNGIAVTGTAVNGTTGNIEVKGVAAGTSLGVVKSGGVATISSGQITAISEAGHAESAGTADNAGQAGKLTVNGGSNIQPVYFANGVPVAINHKIEEDVPDGAVFTDKAVAQSSDSSTSSFPILIKGTANTTNKTEGVKYASNKVTIQPSTGNITTSGTISTKGASIDGTLTVDDIDTGSLDATGDVTIGGTLEVTGTITGSLSGNATTATTAEKTQKVLKFGSKTFDGSTERTITAADLGLSTALKFKGVAETLPTSGMAVGDVWLIGDKEYVYVEDTNGTKSWEDLGDASALADAVSGIQNYEVKAGTGLIGGGKISTNPTISHGENLANDFTGSSNADLTITAGAGEKTINIPKINVDKLGHITSVSNQQVKVTIPSAPTLSISDGSDAAADTTVIGGIGVDKHEIIVKKKTIGAKNPSGVLEVTGNASEVQIGFKTANRGANDILFGDETWHGHDSYIVLCGGDAFENI